MVLVTPHIEDSKAYFGDCVSHSMPLIFNVSPHGALSRRWWNPNLPPPSLTKHTYSQCPAAISYTPVFIHWAWNSHFISNNRSIRLACVSMVGNGYRKSEAKGSISSSDRKRKLLFFPFSPRLRKHQGRWGRRIVKARNGSDPESHAYVVTGVTGLSTRPALDPVCQHSSMEKGGLPAPALAESYIFLGNESQFSVRL